MSEPIHEFRPTKAQWTHVALRVTDIDKTVDWYTTFTPLEVLARREDEDGFGAWLGHPNPDNPFLLVVAQFLPDSDPFAGATTATLTPFSHLGIELPTKEDVDEVAAKGEAAGCLGMPARQMPDPIGYICMLTDPDGNMIEFSYDQGVYETAREKWS